MGNIDALLLRIPLKRRVAAAELERAKLEVAALVVELAARVKASFVRLQGDLQRLGLDGSVVEATALAANWPGGQPPTAASVRLRSRRQRQRARARRSLA